MLTRKYGKIFGYSDKHVIPYLFDAHAILLPKVIKLIKLVKSITVPVANFGCQVHHKR